MEKNRRSLVFSGLCLALVFSVGSVEAAPCDKCQKCDQNGNEVIRESTFCARKCDDGLPTENANDDNDDLGFCPIDDGGGGGGATFTVEVFFDFGVLRGFENIGGPIVNVAGKIHGNRTNLGESPMTVSISELTLPANCVIGDPNDPGFGTTDPATFTLHTARIPPSSDVLTFVSPGFGLIVRDGLSYNLRFDDGAIADPGTVDDCDVDDWYPAPTKTTCLIGNTLTWSQSSSPTGVACNGEIQNQRWRINITGEPPM